MRLRRNRGCARRDRSGIGIVREHGQQSRVADLSCVQEVCVLKILRNDRTLEPKILKPGNQIRPAGQNRLIVLQRCHRGRDGEIRIGRESNLQRGRHVAAIVALHDRPRFAVRLTQENKGIADPGDLKHGFIRTCRKIRLRDTVVSRLEFVVRRAGCSRRSGCLCNPILLSRLPCAR